MERALQGWQGSLSLAGSYLESRGISSETAQVFRLGVVVSHEPGFEKYTGRLAIPYLDRKGPVGFTFRCVAEHDCKQSSCPKYLQMEGQEVGFFNVLALVDSDSSVAHVTEGEIDGITLTQVVGNEPVGSLSGVSKWKGHFPYLLNGFERVVLWSDPDDAGEKMRAKFRQYVTNVDVINMPAPLDVNGLFCSKGADAVKALYLEDEE